jgi:hypothetical protein
MQPEESGDGEPSIIGLKIGFVLLPPFFDRLPVGRNVCNSDERN